MGQRRDKGLNNSQAILDLAFSEGVIQPMNQHHGQSFSGHTFQPKDRYLRCRKCYGYTWIWPESQHNQMTEPQAIDYEGTSVDDNNLVYAPNPRLSCRNISCNSLLGKVRENRHTAYHDLDDEADRLRARQELSRTAFHIERRRAYPQR